METQRCKKCEKKFNYLNVLESVGWGYIHLTCKNCGAKHSSKVIYIFILVFLLSLPMFFLNQIRQLPLTLLLKIMILLLYVVYMTLILGIYPFIIRYSLEDQLDKSSNPDIE